MITFNNVSFRYPWHRPVISSMRFSAERLPLVLLGPNGAGKSTILKLIAGVLAPSEGSIEIDGHPVRRREQRELVGWLPQDVEVIPGMTTLEQVTYAAWLKGLPVARARRAAREEIERFGLASEADASVRSLSGGQRRRLGMAQANVHQPAVLLLDEPYAGLDPEQRDAVGRALIAAAEGTQLVVSTHQTEGLQDLFEWVLVVEDRSVVMSGTTAAFLSHATQDRQGGSSVEDAYRSVLRGP